MLELGGPDGPTTSPAGHVPNPQVAFGQVGFPNQTGRASTSPVTNMHHSDLRRRPEATQRQKPDHKREGGRWVHGKPTLTDKKLERKQNV